MAIKSDRNVHVGLHVTQNVRNALEAESKLRGVSISLLIYSFLERSLLDIGYDIYAKPKDNREVSLPFE
jgi:hypothetical protein